NIATGPYSFAAGQQAQASHQGAFVWADSQNSAFASTTNNQFSVRALGGARFVTGGAGATIDGSSVLTSGNGITIQNSGGAPNIIEGASANFVPNGVEGATIGGGGFTLDEDSEGNSVTANFGTVGGGIQNICSSVSGTVGGGDGNQAGPSQFATIGGG